jgi:hypothetical protein
VVFVYLPFLGVFVIYNAVYALLVIACSGAFFHLMCAAAVWTSIFAFAFIVFMVKSTTFVASYWD